MPISRGRGLHSQPLIKLARDVGHFPPEFTLVIQMLKDRRRNMNDASSGMRSYKTHFRKQSSTYPISGNLKNQTPPKKAGAVSVADNLLRHGYLLQA